MDYGVGSIVWVRRRNGSWWPGQILGLDDLSASHLTSPRSGTPVKLLGREDASVDWYNLEKSKRVKAFRCGEFDDCIEKAESAQGAPLKKREKYARREDAILHALELERQMLQKQAKIGDGQVARRVKRSKYVYFPAESSDSLDYKESLAHAEMLSPQLRGEFPYHGSLVGETESTFMDDVESDSSETDSIDSDSDSSETEPDMDEDMTILAETGRDAEEHESTSSEEPDEIAIIGDMPHLYAREMITSNGAVSKWTLKGKRNNRNLVKRSFSSSNGKGTTYGTDADFEGRRSHLSHKRLGPNMHRYINDFSDALDDDDEMFGLEDDYSQTSRAVSRNRNKIHHGVDWARDDHLASSGYWDTEGFSPIYGDHYHIGGRMRSALVNVDLEVKSSYPKERVPLVSLMSKLDGRAIVGHPIQVETLKDGSSDFLFSAIDDFSNDGSSVLPPAWRTARRTANSRVPRPQVFSSNGAEVAPEFPSLDQDPDFEYRKSNTGSSGHKASLQKKSGLKSHRSSTDKKSLKKVPKKLSLSSNQKTRTLSSLSTEHSLSRKPSHDSSSSYPTDRLIKPEISVPTTVACIPVQLVFSRLLEKINRPPLKAASNAALLNTGAERKS
ncbi:uncharacterized protein LOC130747780 isoform X2 [Lotus japonicus]|uniref:uncharacterized protein LOC130747780 isoform X2 n=1 Tax=Lotus japonicus TaxID=34305 RepID=UPI002589C176|nr:uncharacterized protein LOC130747780 isoform X2 [Lotus japonicus]